MKVLCVNLTMGGCYDPANRVLLVTLCIRRKSFNPISFLRMKGYTFDIRDELVWEIRDALQIY